MQPEFNVGDLCWFHDHDEERRLVRIIHVQIDRYSRERVYNVETAFGLNEYSTGPHLATTRSYALSPAIDILELCQLRARLDALIVEETKRRS